MVKVKWVVFWVRKTRDHSEDAQRVVGNVVVIRFEIGRSDTGGAVLTEQNRVLTSWEVTGVGKVLDRR
jgi:predicted N-acetyltransferase YhbS